MRVNFQFICLPLLVGCTLSSARPLQSPAAFVVFTQNRLYIDALEKPFPPPVMIGSTTSPETLHSEQSDIVSISSTGTIIGHRNGSTVILGAGGSRLEVRVRAVQRLLLSSSNVELPLGGLADVSVRDADGDATIDSEAVTWMTSDPSVAMIHGGKVEAGRRAGSARVVATYGGASAEMLVTVTLRRPEAPAFRSVAKTLRIGSIQRLELLQGPSPAAVWSSSEPKVLASLGQGFFLAKARGQSTVCITQLSDKACAAIEVTK